VNVEIYRNMRCRSPRDVGMVYKKNLRKTVVSEGGGDQAERM
jgi:hypothetical protein